MQLQKAIYISILSHGLLLALIYSEFQTEELTTLKSIELQIETKSIATSNKTAGISNTPSNKNKSFSSLSQNLTVVASHSPTYPRASRVQNEEGIVVLKALVTIFGEVSTVEILESSGYLRLDNAALKAFSKWKFQNQHKKPIWIQKRFRFEMAKL